MNYYSIKKGVSGKVALEDLKASRSAKKAFGAISQVDFINALTDIIEEANMKYEHGVIYYKNNSGMNPGVELLDITQEHPDNQAEWAPIEAEDGELLHHPKLLLFKRMIGTIKLTSFENEEVSGTLAFSISQSGFEIAVGTNVKVCSNMSILCATHRAKSFGKDGVNPQELLDIVKGWMVNYADIHGENLRRIEAMKSKTLTLKEVNSYFGYLYGDAITNNDVELKRMSDHSIVPLNVSSVSKGHHEFLKEAYANVEMETITIWQLYNYITLYLTAEHVDTINIIEQNAILSEYLVLQSGYTPIDAPSNTSEDDLTV
jgi:hypothetical protein